MIDWMVEVEDVTCPADDMKKWVSQVVALGKFWGGGNEENGAGAHGASLRLPSSCEDPPHAGRDAAGLQAGLGLRQCMITIR